MADRNKYVIPTQGGVFRDLLLRLKLIGSLMLDQRVNALIKLIPVASLVYLVSPIDALVGPLDDAGIIALAAYLFIELCPPDVVSEHVRQLSSNNDMVDKQAGADVIDGEVIDDK